MQGSEFPSLTCDICLEPITEEKNFKNKERCFHPFCLDCIAKYIEAKVEKNTAEVPCPALNCDKILDPLSCRPVLPAELFEKWCHVLCESSVLRCERAYCPFADCSVLVLNECGGNITRSECPNCKKLFCFQCKLPWHSGFGCDETEQMRDENDILFGKLVERNKWKICPGCKYRVEQNEGCQNITCRCGFLFCYVCGKTKHACDCYTRNAEEQAHMVISRAVGANFNRRSFNWDSFMVLIVFMIIFMVNIAFVGSIIRFYKKNRIAKHIASLVIYLTIVPFQLCFSLLCRKWRR